MAPGGSLADELKKKLETRWSATQSGPSAERKARLGQDVPHVAADRHVDGDDGGSGSDSDDGIRVVWDSGKKGGSGVCALQGSPAPPTPPDREDVELEDLKMQGNKRMEAKDFAGAVQLYSDAVRASEARGEGCRADSVVMAAVHNNCALAHLRLKEANKAAGEAMKASKLRPDWPKPYYRLAQAYLAQGAFGLAMATGKKGEALLEAAGDTTREFEPLLDKIAVEGAQRGILAGFDGRLLEARSFERTPSDQADPFAPLASAPYDPLLDSDTDAELARLGGENTLLSLAGGVSAGGLERDAAIAAVSKARARGEKKRLSFRSVMDAVAEAKDGDRIILLRGVHNTGGATTTVDKRVLIRGEGRLGEAKIDARSNAPVFRISRSAVVSNLDLDMTGFRECVQVEGGPDVRPLLDNLVIACSGDDGVIVQGRARPIFARCKIQGRKCGVKFLEEGGGELRDCHIEGCGSSGAALMGAAQPDLLRCTIKDNGEEGVVAMEGARGSIIDCRILSNQGPGVDLSGLSNLKIERSSIEGNIGGVWLWDEAQCDAKSCTIKGGTAFGVLRDGASIAAFEGCTIEDGVHSTPVPTKADISNAKSPFGLPEQRGRPGRPGVLSIPEESNKIGGGAGRLPSEIKPFVFIPDKFLRKQ